MMPWTGQAEALGLTHGWYEEQTWGPGTLTPYSGNSDPLLWCVLAAWPPSPPLTCPAVPPLIRVPLRRKEERRPGWGCGGHSLTEAQSHGCSPGSLTAKSRQSSSLE